MCSVTSDSLQPHGLQPTRLLCPWGFSKHEYWTELPCPPPGDLPEPGITATSFASPALAGGFFSTSTTFFFASVKCYTNVTETVWSVFIAWWCWFKSSLWPFNYTHYEAGAKCQSNFLHCMIVLLSQNRDDTKDVDPMREFANNILLSRCSEWSLIS